MNVSSHPFEEPGQTSRTLDPCVLVIFGATGDLTAKKLMPAIYNLKREGQLPTNFVCCGFARRDKSHEVFREEMKKAVNTHSRVKPIDENIWNNFQNQLFYHKSGFDEDEGYDRFAKYLKELDNQFGTKGNRIYYLSTQPSYFTTIIEKLKQHKLLYDHEDPSGKWSRVIIEKPFGHDYNSALALQKELTQHLSEPQLYRIDHYLGKETVQNLLVFRFANSIFENLWNHRYIDRVQFTVAEDIGIGTRGNFYEEQGLVRDIMQNHMMQLLSLIAMEPPVNLSPGAVHDEKVKVLEAVRPYKGEDFDKCAIRGQYAKGYVGGEEAKGYREEDNVAKDSNVETYAAVKLYIDNWRWDGVPFYLRGAKRLPKRATEIAITFKTPPGVLFKENGEQHESNVLAIRIQPNEGIALKINCKVPGPSSPIQPVKMDFRYGAFFGLTPPDAYERLICDCIAGDSTLFARQDEVFHSWKFFTPILEHWANTKPKDFPNYPCGSWGPQSAEEMIARDGRKWRLI
ncbi:glucose-6-phosphate dehydrogenase [Simkania sp.]|uniref:glucose-6-phosphate dehydrogenase n=1 Tax=Simkania sp. TaxID=34094 RepID=UPI003B519A69